MIVFVIGGLVAILAWLTAFAITDAWKQAGRVCDAILNGEDIEPPRSRPRAFVIGDDVIDPMPEPEHWTALDDRQLARFMDDASRR